MQNRFRPKLGALTAAVLSTAASDAAAPPASAITLPRGEAVDPDAAFQAALREANLKLPIKTATRELKEKLDEDLGQALQLAIERLTGKPLDDLAQLEGRLSIIRHDGDDGDTYYLDDTPILRGGPIKLQRSGDEMIAERALRILVGTKLQ